jgi:DNA-binding transcriptional LysR family regulator
MAQLEKFSLQVFRTVAEHLSFRKAAELLFLTQPAVSLQIKALEEDLGIRLFDRAAGKVSLTRQGAILLCHAQKLARIALEAAQELSANEVQLTDQNGPSGRPTTACSQLTTAPTS